MSLLRGLIGLGVGAILILLISVGVFDLLLTTTLLIMITVVILWLPMLRPLSTITLWIMAGYSIGLALLYATGAW